MSNPSLLRLFGFKEAFALVIGSVIGTGIFMKPATMAAQLHSPWMLLLVWLVAGIITLCGAVSNAELASMFPETGGQLVFFQKIYGDAFSFVYGWSSFSVFNTAGNASIAYICAQYLNYFISLPELSEELVQSHAFSIPGIGHFYFLDHFYLKLLTIALLIIVTLISIRSTKESAHIQNVLSAFKLIAISILAVCALGSKQGSLIPFSHDPQFFEFSFTSFAMALTGAFWAYDGWNNLSFVAGEIKDPQRNIPRSLIYGLLTCTFLYILINVAFIYLLGMEDLSASSVIATDVGSKLWGSVGAVAITLVVILTTLGTLNSNVLSTARVTFALGFHNRFFSKASLVHPVFNTPYLALIFNLTWSILLVLSGSFDILTDMLIFVTWFFYSMSALGVILLRFRMPDFPRIYKVWMYPYPTLIFIAFTFTYLILCLYNDISNFNSGRSPIVQSVFGMIICLLGLPLYWFNKKKP